eukprot:2890718-Pyramimonas_sp.AAC.1
MPVQHAIRNIRAGCRSCSRGGSDGGVSSSHNDATAWNGDFARAFGAPAVAGRLCKVVRCVARCQLCGQCAA